jgi:hypothetical protein
MAKSWNLRTHRHDKTVSMMLCISAPSRCQSKDIAQPKKEEVKGCVYERISKQGMCSAAPRCRLLACTAIAIAPEVCQGKGCAVQQATCPTTMQQHHTLAAPPPDQITADSTNCQHAVAVALDY